MTLAVLLSFVLGLGTTLEVAHNHDDHAVIYIHAEHHEHGKFHEHAEHHDHAEDSEHYGFSAEQCSYTVLQNSSPSVAPDNLLIDSATVVSDEPVVLLKAFYCAPRLAFLARAPPQVSRLFI